VTVLIHKVGFQEASSLLINLLHREKPLPHNLVYLLNKVKKEYHCKYYICLGLLKPSFLIGTLISIMLRTKTPRAICPNFFGRFSISLFFFFFFILLISWPFIPWCELGGVTLPLMVFFRRWGSRVVLPIHNRPSFNLLVYPHTKSLKSLKDNSSNLSLIYRLSPLCNLRLVILSSSLICAIIISSSICCLYSFILILLFFC